MRGKILAAMDIVPRLKIDESYWNKIYNCHVVGNGLGIFLFTDSGFIVLCCVFAKFQSFHCKRAAHNKYIAQIHFIILFLLSMNAKNCFY